MLSSSRFNIAITAMALIISGINIIQHIPIVLADGERQVPLPSQLQQELGLLIPLYIYPTTDDSDPSNPTCTHPDWIKVAAASNEFAGKIKIVAIVNPDNGPTVSEWTKGKYTTCIKHLRDNSVTVIGYVHIKTGYGTISGLSGYRPLQDVKDDITWWKDELGGADGIFIDEVTNLWPRDWDNQTTATSFTHSLVDHSLGLFPGTGTLRVVINPGSAYFTSIMAPYTGDPRVVAVVRETDQGGYTEGCADNRSPGPWCNYTLSSGSSGVEALKTWIDDGTLLPQQSAVLIYGATATEEATVTNVRYGVEANVGYHYLLDKGSWSETPTKGIWDAQINELMRLSTSSPTVVPTLIPTERPTNLPTKTPTKTPTDPPTKTPSKTPMKAPTMTPTKTPTSTPTNTPTMAPTKIPTDPPTKTPMKAPTMTPTKTITSTPTNIPTMAPTKTPTDPPTTTPSKTPMKSPTMTPTSTPTNIPSMAPTLNPTMTPVLQPPVCSQDFGDRYRFLLTINTDSRGTRTKFKLLGRNQKGKFRKSVIAAKKLPNNKLVTFDKCIRKGKCYKFIIRDRDGDGICCAYGMGWYELSLDGKVIRKSTFENKKREKKKIGRCN